MQHLLQDLKHSARTLAQHPGFTVTAVAALTLGIGINTAIFSVVNAVLLKPVPFPQPDRLVMLMITSKGRPPLAGASPPEFGYWRAQTAVLEDVAAFRTNELNYTSGDRPERVQAGQVSRDYFRLFGARLMFGRGFSRQEDLPNGPKAAVLSYRFWKQRLGADPHVLGKTLTLSGDAYTVVGVVGKGFDMRQFGDPDLWVPFQLGPSTSSQASFFQVAARLKPGVTLQQAQARLRASAAEYRRRVPDSLGTEEGFTVVPLQEAIVGPQARTSLWVLFGAVAFVLLIACATVANLLLVRATARRRELAIRSALGAGRGRIVRQLLTESVLLSLAGGILGLGVGFAGMRALLAVNTAKLPRLGPAGSLVGLDWRVVGFTLALSLATGILFGLAPALAGRRSDLNTVIKDSGSCTGSGFRHNKARSVFVMLEAALAVVLLIGAGLMIRTSLALGRVDPGFRPDHVLLMRTSLSGSRFLTSAGVEQTAHEALAQVRAIPGVAGATATCCPPILGGARLPFDIVGRTNSGPVTGAANFVVTLPGYVNTFRIPLLKGRTFNDRDDAGARPVVIINHAFAERFWSKGQDPLKDRILIGGGTGIMKQLAKEPVRQIIGIVGDVRARGLKNDAGPTMYIPQAQMADALNALIMRVIPLVWAVRTKIEPAALSKRIQETVERATGLPLTSVRSMDKIVSVSTSRQRFGMLLMSLFGGSALLLAVIGIYGLTAYSVQQRTQEIGIRMALGADAGRVKSMLLGETMRFVAVGIATGLTAAFYATNLLASFLFGVAPHNAVVFVAVPVVLLGAAVVSVWVPAGRASRVDPLDALRYE